MNITSTTTYVDVVRDGDSFHGTSGEVRLVDVCAPERGRPGYELAKTQLESLILRKTVTMITHGRDTFGRLLADVHVNGVHVNARMRTNGNKC